MAFSFRTPKRESQNWDFCCLEILNVHIFPKSNMFGTCEGNVLQPIWFLFTLSTKALNIQNSCMNPTPKVGVHFEVITLSPLVKVYFAFEHTLLASCVLAFYT
jgi:hypothetical protein